LRLAGRWRIADFGIARDLAEETATYTFAGAGTMPYMAPELWENRPATVKTDLYALGVLAYEVLAGVRPFPGPDEPRFRDQHLYAVPADLTGVAPGVRRLVLRMLAKNPASRPQDARAVLEELNSAR
jgi:serine/threonine protein kinase